MPAPDLGAKRGVSEAADAVGRCAERGGACPPSGHGLHRYRFRLYALSVDRLDLPPRPGCRDVERAAEAHSLGRADLIGTYSR